MDKQDYIKAFEGAERRYAVAEMRVEKRAEGDAEVNVVEGYAALFNSPTVIGNWFREVILPGAFDDVLQDDVRALFNHDANLILARTASKTLEIGVDTKGLWYRYTTPQRQYALDLVDAINAGDVSQSSFAFRAEKTNWVYDENDPMDTREIVKVAQLYDVSPVTYPAYSDTTVAKRSYDAFVEERKKENPAARSAEDKGLDVYEAQLQINKNRV